MSPRTSTGAAGRREQPEDAGGEAGHGGLASPRTAALAGVALLTAAYCATLYRITSAVGGSTWLLGGVAVAIGGAVLLRRTDERTVLAAAGAAAIVGALWYATTASTTVGVGTVGRAIADTVAMASGISITGLAAVDAWVAAIVPFPVFVSAYMAIRGRYVLATVAGGWLLLFLALTGDAAAVETLLGALGAVAAIAFGELHRRGGSLASADLVVTLLAAMAVVAVTVPVVPAGEVDPLDPGSGLDLDGTDLEGSGPAGSGALDDQLLSGDSVTAGGPITLSPEVRFVAVADERRRWRVGVLDHYDGDGWTLTGSSREYRGSLLGPPGPSQTLDQYVDLRTSGEAIPAAAYPVDVSGPAADVATVSSAGTLGTDETLSATDDYSVRSEIPTPTTDQLQSAGTDYPASIGDRYTQLPESTPDRVDTLTDQVTADADSPYETAVAVQAYLQDTNAYSQDVSAPEGDMVDAFLFEMDAGYCTYFASSMAAMLRTQGVPARVAVGYNGGQYAGEDTWVVRGTDAHAWVEVYFPDVGWVEFDPTPASGWRDARVDRIESARENGSTSADVPESAGRDVRYQPPEQGGDGTGEPSDTGGTDGPDGNGSTDATPGGQRDQLYSGLGQPVLENGTSQPYVDPDESIPEVGSGGDGGSEGVAGPVGDVLLHEVDPRFLGLVLLAGGVAGARRSGASARVRESARLLWQRRRGPETDVERATRRLDLFLERRYRARDSAETRREYLRSLERPVDERIRRAVDLVERARYGGRIEAETADELVALVDDLVGEELGPTGVILR